MDYSLPTAGLTFQELLTGLVNAAQELGELGGREEDDDAVENAEARVGAWRKAVEDKAANIATDGIGMALAAPVAPVTPAVELEPIQAVAVGLTFEQTDAAFDATVRRYSLRSAAQQRLRRSVHFSTAMLAAHGGDWRTVNRVLGNANVIQ